MTHVTPPLREGASAAPRVDLPMTSMPLPMLPVAQRSAGLKNWLLAATAVALIAQVALPAHLTPAAFIGRTMTTIYTQPGQRAALIEALKDELKSNRLAYSQTLQEYQNFEAVCGGIGVFMRFIDPNATQLGADVSSGCSTMAQQMNRQRLESLQREIRRLETELRKLDVAI